MRLAIFGATTCAGGSLVEQALEHGHQVSVLVQDAAAWPQLGARVRVVEGDPLDPDDVFQTVAGADAVLSALGVRGRARAAPATRNIVQAMTLLEIRRLIAVTGFGIGDSRRLVPWWDRWRLWVAPRVVRDREAAEAVLRSSGLAWTVVRPGPLQQRRRTGRYRAGVDVADRFAPVSSRAVAHFMLRQIDSDRFVGQAPSIVRC